MVRLLIASDHAGFVLKNKLMDYFKNKFEFTDFGTNSEESVDYPDFAHKLANEISTKNLSGVLICGSGVGMSMVANRYNNVRAALCFNENMAKLSVCLLFNHRLPKWIWKTLWQNMPWEAGVATDKYIKEHSIILEEKGWVEANEYIKELRKTIKQTEHELAKPM